LHWPDSSSTTTMNGHIQESAITRQRADFREQRSWELLASVLNSMARRGYTYLATGSVLRGWNRGSRGIIVGGEMSNTVDDLILDLLEWLGPKPRPYVEVLDAWRTSCPRLPVWEEANDRGFIVRQTSPERGATIAVSAMGVEYLRERRPQLSTR
jgi:hypothetical protein